MKVGFMATYPPRMSRVRESIASAASQLDKLLLCANGYGDRADFGSNVEIAIPEIDYKDVGKFIFPAQPDDYVFLLDDDIIYPADYADRMITKLNSYAPLDAVVGLHGVTYPDFFTGDPSHRSVQVFTQQLEDDYFVNQLGTGTVCCRGHQMPSLNFMLGSERFVDVRFALHQRRLSRPMVVVERAKGWLRESEGSDATLFSTFTKNWPIEVIKEVQEIAGYSKVPSLRPAKPASNAASNRLASSFD